VERVITPVEGEAFIEISFAIFPLLIVVERLSAETCAHIKWTGARLLLSLAKAKESHQQQRQQSSAKSRWLDR
jgi:hypothetical protein